MGMNTPQTNRDFLNAASWIRYYVANYGHNTIQHVYAELASLGFTGDAAEDVLDAAAITVTAEQASDLDPIIFRAIAS